MSKLKRIIIDICTLGIFEIWLRKKAKKCANQTNKELIYSSKYNFKINDFINDLGGINNIKNINVVISNIKIELIDPNKFNENIKNKYGIKGISKTNNNLIIVIGDNAKAIVDDILKIKNSKI